MLPEMQEIIVRESTSDQVVAWLTLVAVFAGPFVGMAIQRRLDDAKEKRGRRLAMFRALMSTRLDKLSEQHVTALSLIDVEYHKRNPKDSDVLHAWIAYHEHLKACPPLPSVPTTDPAHAVMAAACVHWDKRCDTLLIELLEAMGRPLGYSFTKDELARGGYRPDAHKTRSQMRDEVNAWCYLLSQGKEAVTIRTVYTDEEVNNGRQFREAIIELAKRADVKIAPPS